MTTSKIVAPRKLIEVALPLDDINKAAAREKSIRHGHPSTLHLWWARRPLAAARAVLFAQLVNDPSWKYSEEELKKPQVKSAITRKRNELFQLISELVQWGNTTNQNVLGRARTEIRASWSETCEANKHHPDAKTLFDPKNLPAFHDPFAGGGTIPLEAQRLGLDAHATDLNPVAVLINKAMSEIPPKFVGRLPIGPIPAGRKQTKAKATEEWSGSRGLAEDVRRYGDWMRVEAESRIGHLYPKVVITKEMAKERKDLTPYIGEALTVIAWLWARTVRSPNPAAHGLATPLCSSLYLSTKPGKETWLSLEAGAQGPVFTVCRSTPGINDTHLRAGTRAGKAQDFMCLYTRTPITRDYIRDEGKAGRLGVVLMAIVLEGNGNRVYLSPSAAPDTSLLAETRETMQSRQTFLSGSTPTRAMITGGVCSAYGLTTYGHLFTTRQLIALTTFSDLVQEVRSRVRQDAIAAGIRDDGCTLEAGGSGATAYADSIATYLAFVVDKETESLSTLCTWSSSPKNELIVSTFRRQALPMTWDFAEANCLANSSGSLEKNIEAVAKVVELPLSANASGFALQADAQIQAVSAGKVVSTDPPYYDNIGYADLSDFFYVWLRRTLGSVFPALLATLAAPKADELVATLHRHGSQERAEAFFLDGMTRAMQRISEQSHPAFPVTIYYAFKQSETESDSTGSTGWETFLEAVLRANLVVVGTWPVRTEREGRSTGIGTNALASSIVLVCRRRAIASTPVSQKEFLRTLSRSLPRSIAEMTADPVASIAPVDLAQACIGPGMAIFSQHEAVLEADGSPMSVHSALVHINKAIDEYFAHAEGELDADTRFCIGWFDQFGFEAGEFGTADVLARAKGTSVDGVREAGVIEAGKGKVRLLPIKNLPKKWDPATDTRAPIWEALHHMCKALAEGEGEAGALLARMPQKQDAIRQLAYRLYTLCAERKKQAELGRPYNDLITSWPAIVEASQKAPPVNKQLGLL
jgi:putative DNA methylase